MAVFHSATNVQLYVDGKPATSGTNSGPLMAVNSLTLGGVYRGTSQLISPLTGLLDDVGLFSSGSGSGLVLTEVDAALIKGLGRTGAVGLSQLPAARSLASAPVGATGTIGGVSWQRVGGLNGAIGDWGGPWPETTPTS